MENLKVETINSYIQELDGAGQVSDGYHTFDELYEHRIELYLSLCCIIQYFTRELADGISVWKSKVHSDGSTWDGWFILGIGTEPGKQITYHLPNSYWDRCSRFTTLDVAPEYDGHTSADVIVRLQCLVEAL